MEKRAHWSPLSRMEYEEGRARRLLAEDIEPGAWYTSAHIGAPDDNLSCYAFEYLVETKSIQPIDDLYVIEAYLLDADGQRVGQGDSLIKSDGLIIEPAQSAYEGYLLDAAEKLGLGPLAINETVELAIL